MEKAVGATWLKISSWHIVRDVVEGAGQSVVVTTMCGLKKFSPTMPFVSDTYGAGEKTCESCLRQWSKD